MFDIRKPMYNHRYKTLAISAMEYDIEKTRHLIDSITPDMFKSQSEYNAIVNTFMDKMDKLQLAIEFFESVDWHNI